MEWDRRSQLFCAVTVLCFVTAKSKSGVMLGVLLIVMFRLILAGFFYLTEARGGH